MGLIVCRHIVIHWRYYRLDKMKPELRELGSRIRRYRNKLGISQEELADRSGLHRTYVGGVERGERNIGVLNLLRIANALKIPPGRLLLNK